MFLAGLGFILSVIAHLTALAGVALPVGNKIWVLHVGIFVVWLPTVAVSYRVTNSVNRKDFWKVALSGCPSWMRISLMGLFAYAILNFILSLASQNNGYHSPMVTLPSQIRLFSGHWMIFYGVAFSTMYSVIHAPHLFDEKKCPNGHSISSEALFCSKCGSAICQHLE
jgi:hypothetical protein